MVATSVWSTNLAILMAVVALSLWIGWRAVFLIYAPAVYLAAAVGIWLFYVQHQFEDTYWKATRRLGLRHGRAPWEFRICGCRRFWAGSRGASDCTTSITSDRAFRTTRSNDATRRTRCSTGLRVITLAESVRTLRLTLWDETRERLVGFRDISVSQP